ncbi:MAG: AsmA-like C-terminal domain-containing protein [Nitrospirales bacterium]
MLRRLHYISTHFWYSFVVWGTVLLGLLAVGIPILILTVWSDTQWVKEALTKRLQDALDGPIHIETLNLDIFPSPEVHMAGLSFQTDDQISASLHVNHLEVAIGWQSLWEKKLFITRALVDQPELTLRVPLIAESEEPSTFPFPTIHEMAIHNGQLHLLHVSGVEEPSTLDWDDIHLSITDSESEGSSSFQLSAQIPHLQPPSTIALNGTISLLEEETSLSQPENLSLFSGTAIQGQIDVSQFHLGHLVQFLRMHPLKTPIQTLGNFQGTFTYTLQQDHDLLTFHSFQVSLDEWSFGGRGKIANTLHESPRMQVSGAAKPIAIQHVPALLPDDWLPAPLLTFLQEHKVTGTLELLKGAFDGPLDGNGSWDATGEVGLEAGQFLPASDQPLITNVSATVTFAPSVIKVFHARGNIAPFTMTTPETTIDLEGEIVKISMPAFRISEKDWNLNGTADFTKKQNEPSTLTVSGSALPITIHSLATMIPETWRPISVQTILTERDLNGEMELLTGSVQWIGDAANTVKADGVFRVANGHILVDPNHPPVTQLSGAIVFDSNIIRMLNWEGRFNHSQIFVKEATLEWKDSEIFMDLQGKGLLSAHDVHQSLLRDPRSRPQVQHLSPYSHVQGNIHISTRLQGSLNHPSQLRILQGDLLLDEINLETSSDRLPVIHITGQMSFDEQQIQIHRFNGILGESPIDIKGQWSFRREAKALNLNMVSVWSSHDLQILFPSMTQPFSTFDGRIGTTLTVSGSNLRPDYQAEFDLTNIGLETKGLFQKPSGVPAIIGVQGKIQEEEKAVLITKGEVAIPPYKLEARGKLSWSDAPYIRGVLQTESGTGAMFPTGVVIGDKNLGLSSFAITWGLEGRDWDWSTWYMNGKVEATNRTSQSTSSKPNEETQLIMLQWQQKEKTGKGELTLKDIPVESLLGPQSDSRSPLTGTVSLVTSLQMNLGSPELILRSLTGKGQAALRQGLIQTGPVLSKIMGILNVPSLLMGKVNLLEEGLPYDQLDGSFSIENGLLSSQDLALKSPVLKLTAAGSYDLPTEKLHGMIAVSPFGAYSNLLKDIPLFGSLVKGERKGLMTALFEVKGPRTEPDITYLPLESFTGGLKGLAQFAVDVLTNIVTLPIPDKNNPNSDPSAK